MDQNQALPQHPTFVSTSKSRKVLQQQGDYRMGITFSWESNQVYFSLVGPKYFQKSWKGFKNQRHQIVNQWKKERFARNDTQQVNGLDPLIIYPYSHTETMKKQLEFQ